MLAGPRPHVLAGAVALTVLAACSGDHDAGQFGQRGSSTSAAASVGPGTSSAVSTTTPVSESTSTVAGATTTLAGSATASTSSAGPNVVVGTAVAGAAGGVEQGAGPFTQTDPFSEVVRLADGTCVGWESRGGSTSGLAVGAPVAVLDPATNGLLGSGTITGSRWEDPSGGANQWTCFFDFRVEVASAPAGDVLVKVRALEPWTARPDPAQPGVRVASVSTDAAIRLIASCPALPAPTPTVSAPASSVATTTALPPPTTVAGPPVTGWKAIGQYWSIGVDALCKSGLPVNAIARPCRPPSVGSDYVTDVADSNHPGVKYTDGAAIPAGTALTVVVTTGRPCG